MKSGATLVASDDEESQQAARWLAAKLGASSDTKSGLVYWLRSDPPPGSISDGEKVLLIPGSFVGAAALTRDSRYQVFVAQSGAGPSDVTRQVWDRSMACAEIMGEALKRAGRNLTRTTLMQALESLYRVESSLEVPVTFMPTRRVGAEECPDDARWIRKASWFR